MTCSVGLVRVLTTTDEAVLHSHACAIQSRLPGLHIETCCIPDQPRGVYDAETEAIAATKVLEAAMRFAESGVQAVIVSCAADPGVELCRQHVRVPVIGAGRAAAATALAYGRPVGVLGITRQVPRAVREVLGERLQAAAVPAGVSTTVDLLTPQGRKAAVEAAGDLLARGAEVILLACTGMTTVGLAPVLRSQFRVPVVDAVIAAGMAAWHVVMGIEGGAANCAV